MICKIPRGSQQNKFASMKKKYTGGKNAFTWLICARVRVSYNERTWRVQLPPLGVLIQIQHKTSGYKKKKVWLTQSTNVEYKVWRSVFLWLKNEGWNLEAFYNFESSTILSIQMLPCTTYQGPPFKCRKRFTYYINTHSYCSVYHVGQDSRPFGWWYNFV